MITFILIDFHSAEETLTYIKHLCGKINIEKKEISFVIIDNSCDKQNFKKLSESFCTKRKIIWQNSTLEEKEAFGISTFLWESPKNTGYAIGNNIGAEIALKFISSDYFLFSNSDILILDDILNLKNLVEELKKQNVGLVGPSIIGKDGKHQSPYKEVSITKRWGYEYFTYPFSQFFPSLLNSDDLIEFKENPVFRIMGSFFLISSKIFKEIEGFDEHTFLFAEEMIMAKRLQQKGFFVHYIPDIHLLHNHSTTINKAFNNTQRLKQRFRSEMYYYKTYCNTNKLTLLIMRINFQLYIIKKTILTFIKQNLIKPLSEHKK